MISNELLLAITGVASIVFGLVLIIFPGSGTLELIWLVGVYLILFGMLLIGFGMRLRSMNSA